MRRGAWHQFGFNSQKLALEQLENGNGVGVILSPRDLAFEKANEYSEKYRNAGGGVLFDPQFYIPGYTNSKLESYPISDMRQSVSDLCKINDTGLSDISRYLETINSATGTEAILAPSVMYQAGRPDLIDLNRKLLRAAKKTGDSLGIPTFASVLLGSSVIGSDETMDVTMNAVTSLSPNGWYVGFEYEQSRIPHVESTLLRCAKAGLALAKTGLPFIHSFAGPLALLSFASGASGVGIGHSQNLWRFCPERFEPPTEGGGGGDAPPRFFSKALWGTIVYPDEMALLSTQLIDSIAIKTDYSHSLTFRRPFLPWARWEAGKHLVATVCSTVSDLCTLSSPLDCLGYATELLKGAQKIYDNIAATGVELRDDSNAYHRAWINVLERVKNDCQDDYDYLSLIA